ncbi:MAG: glutamine amidotransferase [Candidatus Firestonebacteria bacterium]
MKFEFNLWIIIFLISGYFSLIYIAKFAERSKKLLIILRAIIFLFLIFIFLHPVLIKEEKKYKKSKVVVLVDVSKSMDIKYPFHKFSVVKDILKNKIEGFKKTHEVICYTYAGTPVRMNYENILRLEKLDGETTDIGNALVEVKEELMKEGDSVDTNLVLISDGNHNGLVDPLEVSKSIDIPVHTIGIGSTRTGFDLEINDISVSNIAFRNMETNIIVKVKGYNSIGKMVNVLLKKDKNVISDKFVKIKEEGKEIEVRFNYIPKETGLQKFQVIIPPEKGEINKENNLKEFNLNVLKEKVRILYLSGCPNFEYRFLRQALKTNPNYEVVSFIILRSNEDVVFFPENELTLIPFPATEIFTKEIFSFDVVVLENFSYIKYFAPELLNSVKDFVEKFGGAFVMIGGDESYGRGGYKGTQIEEILPVEISGFDEVFESGFFKVKPLEHPINTLSDTKEENLDIWQSLPELEGCNKFVRAKKGAVVLAGTEDLKDADGAPLPVITIWPKGQGRVLSVGTNSTWRWSMGLAGAGKGNFYYSKYWHQMFNWLINTPELKQVKVSTDKKVYGKGETIRVLTTVLNDYYQYEDNAVVDINLTDPSGKTLSFNNIPYIGDGIYECSLIGEDIGKYTLRANSYKGNKNLGKDVIITEVSPQSSEDKDIFLNEKLLSGIANNSGGEYFNSQNLSDFNIKLKPVVEIVTSTNKSIIWDSLIFFVLIIIFLTVDWYVRRISGLL